MPSLPMATLVPSAARRALSLLLRGLRVVIDLIFLFLPVFFTPPHSKKVFGPRPAFFPSFFDPRTPSLPLSAHPSLSGSLTSLFSGYRDWRPLGTIAASVFLTASALLPWA